MTRVSLLANKAQPLGMTRTMRNFLAGLGGGSGAFAAALVCLALLGAGYWVQSSRDAGQDSNQLTGVAREAMTPEVAKDPAPDTAEERSAVEEEAPDTGTTAPAFDEVRREQDGVTVIAGRAEPGADVSVLQNGVEVAKTQADNAGKFAAIALIPADGTGHVLSLSQKDAGVETASDEEVILAPTAPVVATLETPQQTEPMVQATQDSLPDEGGLVDELTETAQRPKPLEEEEGTAPQPEMANLPAEELVTVDNTTTPEVQPETEKDNKETNLGALAIETEPVQPAVAAPVLRSTATGVELLNTPGPQAMTNVAIDTISYSDVGEVELAGRAQSQATSVRIYLNNTSVVNLPVDDQGRWRGEVPDVDQGIYILRVDEVAADGKITSRVETPFKREFPEVLAEAAAAQDGPIKAITVQKGATLWAIARDRYGDGALYVRVFEANTDSIRDPDLIYPGQIFELPE